jgi:lipid-binding SYLF domain-containing protein
LLKGKLQLGADAGVTAGPVGRHASVATDVLLKTGIFSYSRSKGLFAGVSLEGAAITMNDSANEDVYGKGLTGKDILSGRARVNNTVKPYVDALERYSPARRVS